ncbi:hypothetical protein M3Y97_00513200 [Aphelenchoides bicaudatus]|nr:hypothetical protein M3Y97_00513200 [Aphelenchoides bicaudatus]
MNSITTTFCNFVKVKCIFVIYAVHLLLPPFIMTSNKQKSQLKTSSSTGLSITQIPSKIWNVLRGDYNESDDQAKEEPLVEESIEKESVGEETTEDQLEDENKPIESIDCSFLEVDEFSFDKSIDMNAWKVSIPLVERRRRFRTGKIYFVYIMTIERKDETLDQSNAQCCLIGSRQGTSKKKEERDPDDEEFDDENELETQFEEFEALSQLPKAWSIARSYDEFYVFDRRLRSHFGINTQPFALLPDRKMKCPRTKQFLELHRKHFESFLQQLSRQTNLKHSELLFAFLTNPGESGFENSLISANDIETSPTAKQRKQSETDDGEYLKPFISRLLARALTNDDIYAVGVVEEHAKFETNSMDSGAYSFNQDAASEDAHEQSILSKVSLKNPHLSHPKLVMESAEEPTMQEVKALETFQQLSENITSMATYLLNAILQPHRYLKTCAFTVVDLFSNTLNRLFGRELKTAMDGVLDENTILYIVNALHEALFEENQAELTQEEVQQRRQLAERLLKHWLVPTALPQLSEMAADRTNQTVHRIFTCFQNATLNRQLAFVLLDKLAQHILPPDAEQILNKLHFELNDSNK